MNLYINQSFSFNEKVAIYQYAHNGYVMTRKIDK